jgi:Flp pilus assembly protein TadD
LGLVGCAGKGLTLGGWSSGGDAEQRCTALDGDQELTVSMAQQMADQGQLHAALATLDQLPMTLAEVRMRKARLLRALGMDDAQALYQSLLDTCLVAEGLHGLGQMAAARGDFDEAIEQLHAAVQLQPTESVMRNDLGVIYLHQRQLDKAYFELMTAVQLSKGRARSSENLLTLMLYQDRWEDAGALANSYAIDAERFEAAQVRVVRLREEDRQVAAQLASEQDDASSQIE